MFGNLELCRYKINYKNLFRVCERDFLFYQLSFNLLFFFVITYNACNILKNMDILGCNPNRVAM